MLLLCHLARVRKVPPGFALPRYEEKRERNDDDVAIPT